VPAAAPLLPECSPLGCSMLVHACERVQNAGNSVSTLLTGMCRPLCVESSPTQQHGVSVPECCRRPEHPYFALPEVRRSASRALSRPTLRHMVGCAGAPPPRPRNVPPSPPQRASHSVSSGQLPSDTVCGHAHHTMVRLVVVEPGAFSAALPIGRTLPVDHLIATASKQQSDEVPSPCIAASLASRCALMSKAMMRPPVWCSAQQGFGCVVVETIRKLLQLTSIPHPSSALCAFFHQFVLSANIIRNSALVSAGSSIGHLRHEAQWTSLIDDSRCSSSVRCVAHTYA